MKILVVLDTHEYSRNIMQDVTRLATNTLADIVFLGVQEKSNSKPERSLVAALLRYQHDLYSSFSPEDLPYEEFSNMEWQKKKCGDWLLSSRSMKKFTLRIRTGSVAKETISLAAEIGSDLIILGCSSQYGCEWDGEMNVPLRIARNAPCSVLVIKKVGRVKQIVSILDQSAVSQESLEMVNQLVTLHDAGLKIVGVKEQGARQDKIERQMVELLKYYNERRINAWIKLLNSQEIKDYVTTSSREGIVALWMGGKKSLLRKLFSRSMVDRLLGTTQSSLLVLR